MFPSSYSLVISATKTETAEVYESVHRNGEQSWQSTAFMRTLAVRQGWRIHHSLLALAVRPGGQWGLAN